MGRRRGGPPRRRGPVATGDPDSQRVGSFPTVRHLMVAVVVVNPQRVGILVHVRGRARVMETWNRGLRDGRLGSVRGHDELVGWRC